MLYHLHTNKTIEKNKNFCLIIFFYFKKEQRKTFTYAFCKNIFPVCLYSERTQMIGMISLGLSVKHVPGMLWTVWFADPNYLRTSVCAYVSRAMTLLPMAACTAISNICLGMESFSRSHMALPIVYARSLPWQHSSRQLLTNSCLRFNKKKKKKNKRPWSPVINTPPDFTAAQSKEIWSVISS